MGPIAAATWTAARSAAAATSTTPAITTRTAPPLVAAITFASPASISTAGRSGATQISDRTQLIAPGRVVHHLCKNARAKVDVDKLRMLGHIAKIRFRVVKVLNQVI